MSAGTVTRRVFSFVEKIKVATIYGLNISLAQGRLVLDKEAIRRKYDLKADAHVHMQSTINPYRIPFALDDVNFLSTMTIDAFGKKYTIEDMDPYPVFTEDATYTVNGLSRERPPPSVYFSDRDDTLILVTTNKNVESTAKNDGGETYDVIESATIYDRKDGSVIETVRVDRKNDIDYSHDHINDHVHLYASFDRDSINFEELNRRFHYADHEYNIYSTTTTDLPHGPVAKIVTATTCSHYREIELAVAYDSTFCAGSFGVQEWADASVEAIVAGVSERFSQSGLCTRVKLSHLEGHCKSSTDPYKAFVDMNKSGCSNGSGLLHKFRDYWEEHRTNIRRDVAHLFSGTGLECTTTDWLGLPSDCTIGCAFVGRMCQAGAYGVNHATFSFFQDLQSVLVTHELGHNCDARHHNFGSDFIMNPSITAASKGFHGDSVRAMLREFESVQASCISQGFPSPQPSSEPTLLPSTAFSTQPSQMPSQQPSISLQPSWLHTFNPSTSPSFRPSHAPSQSPSYQPTASHRPSVRPVDTASHRPSVRPVDTASHRPSVQPVDTASHQPSVRPVDTVSHQPSLLSVATATGTTVISEEVISSLTATPMSTVALLSFGLMSLIIGIANVCLC